MSTPNPLNLPLCETTQTPRLPLTFCIDLKWGGGCGTYVGNLGPCEYFEEGMNGRCVYCDHHDLCHPSKSTIERLVKGLNAILPA